MHRIALTAGEPAGIGPELLVRVAQQAWPFRIVAIADRRCLHEAAARLGLPLTLVEDDPGQRAPLPAGQLALHPAPLFFPATPGRLDARNADAILAMLRSAADGAGHGRFDAIVTAPVQKSVLDRADAPFSGHTEFFQALAGIQQVVMMLVAPGDAARPPLRVALATTHLPLRAVADAIQPEPLEHCIRVLDAGLKRDYGIARPRICVLGLNPHAGEDGHFGDEETRVIAPLLRRLRAQGLLLEGPRSADTAFSPQRLASSDAFLAMYHDQGLPVLKFASFGHAVNVTLGLPYVRTSVDHGTALDIAGRGEADPGSLKAALTEAARMLDARAHG
ncbi:MAG: 4-hydroxythreonine-4-phosphate dehydrogenase PdxA [Xanthomonadales bacterium]|nr:4-hydroxythreonine-4-phosphate dehydrogenase [Xanthomonadales bacterium]MCC6594450.1 4-hydroxythreonine-4-phosphate dehydrogenase PdxA [Xanthomonadales bacterium]MCE7932491.1 4-hydroxythreonine-4-phosphate dehydrogenase PdxA [Xanthomonadales bacterium PRO6]